MLVRGEEAGGRITTQRARMDSLMMMLMMTRRKVRLDWLLVITSSRHPA